MYVCVGVGSEGIEYGWIYSTKVSDRGMCMHVVNGVSIEPFFCVYLASRCTPPPRPPKVVEVVEVVEVICVWLYFTTKWLNGRVEVQ